MRIVTVVVVAAISASGAGIAQEKPAPAKASPSPGLAPSHVVVTPTDVTWAAAPAALPKGAMMMVLSGDPSQAGAFAIRAKMPAGYKIAAHWHPTDENLTVISGTFAVGMGEKFDEAALKSLPAGSYARMPAEMRHYAMAKTDTVIQVHGMGPFALNYVNPADDPRTVAASPATK